MLEKYKRIWEKTKYLTSLKKILFYLKKRKEKCIILRFVLFLQFTDHNVFNPQIFQKECFSNL